MDPLDEHGERDAARKAMGVARRLADRVGLERLARGRSGAAAADLVDGETCEPGAWRRGGGWQDLRAARRGFAGSGCIGERRHRAACGARERARLRAPWRGDAARVLHAAFRAGEVSTSAAPSSGHATPPATADAAEHAPQIPT